ncbi:MAG: SsrA-binding protein SmpB [Gammaproteobacteria bacterium AqS3]|nr:SsrA-binding protein SmpB [Gammaproteobacteria bacterium AqS3]
MPEDRTAGREFVNRRARHDYHIDTRYDAGMVLHGWEVKALRAGRANLTHAYVHVAQSEVWLIGLSIQPLPNTADRDNLEPDRTRKLLLNRREIAQLMAHTTIRGKTCVPLRLHWKNNLAKCEIALARGKHQRDKREDVKRREWQRARGRILRSRD